MPETNALSLALFQDLGGAMPKSFSLENGAVQINGRRPKRHGRPLEGEADGPGHEVIARVYRPGTEFFVCGPVTSTGRFLKANSVEVGRATMQGGFLPYSFRTPTVRLPQFEGKAWMPTFNLNGDRKMAEVFLNHPIADRRFVGKNVCHTAVFERGRLDGFRAPECEAASLFLQAAELYFEGHFHDPTAAVSHVHPEIGTWVKGKPCKQEGGWTTLPDENGDMVLADIDYEALWYHLMTLR